MQHLVRGCHRQSHFKIGFGIRAKFGLFLAPILAHLGWDRETFSRLSHLNLKRGLGQPIADILADRFGMVKIGTVSGF